MKYYTAQVKTTARSTDYTAVKMDRKLYEQVKRRARGKFQTYSEYVRQLIVADLLAKHDEAPAPAAPAANTEVRQERR
jgi:Arc/MetJ-type ribon-helix-helix transcriptional regulator